VAVHYPATPEGMLRMLLDTISAAGVQVSAYDVQVLEWLAKQPPAACAMIASLTARAAEPVAGFMPMDTSDIDPETGEGYGSDD
jgi:hypothetical protein